MFRTNFVCGIFLVALSLSQVGHGFAQDVRKSRSAVNDFSLSEEHNKTQSRPEPVVLVFHAAIVELRGSVESSLKSAGFRAIGARHRYVFDEDGSRDLSAILREIAKEAEIKVISRPQIRCLSGQSADVFSGTQAKLQYLTRGANGAFELHDADAQHLGFGMSLVASVENEKIGISSLKFTTTFLDGRELVPGVDLEIGKPIISTLSWETSVAHVEPEKIYAIVPGRSDFNHVIFFTGQRIDSSGTPRTKTIDSTTDGFLGTE